MQSLRLPHGDPEDSLLGLSPKELVHRVMDIHRCQVRSNSTETQTPWTQTLNQDLIPKFQAHLDHLFDNVIGLFGVYVSQGESKRTDLIERMRSKLVSDLEESILKLTEKRKTERNQGQVMDSAMSALIDAHGEIKSTWDTIAQLLGHHVLDKQLEKDKVTTLWNQRGDWGSLGEASISRDAHSAA